MFVFLEWTQVTLQLEICNFSCKSMVSLSVTYFSNFLFLQEYSEKVLQFNGMSALITLPKTGFYLGDSLVVSGRVENPSNTSKKVKVGLRVVRVSLLFREYYKLTTVWDLELIRLWIDFAPSMQSLLNPTWLFPGGQVQANLLCLLFMIAIKHRKKGISLPVHEPLWLVPTIIITALC